MSVDTAFEQLREANPVIDPVSLRKPSHDIAVLLAATRQRSADMQTHDETQVKSDKPKQKRGLAVAVASAAFIAVVVGGAVVALWVSGDPEQPTEPAASSTSVSSETDAGVPNPPFLSVADAAVAFVYQWNEGSYEEYSAMLVNRGDVNRSSLPPEQEEQFLFRRALESHLELGACTENSTTSITCQVTQDGRVHQLLSGGADDGYQLAIRLHVGRIESWGFNLAAGRDPGFWGEWDVWSDPARLLEIDPRADTGGQLEISAEEAANLYIAEIERFLEETGLG